MNNTILVDERLTAGQSKFSSSGQYQLIYQGDGNLVIYDTTVLPHHAVWATGTQNHTPGFCILQSDGNFVVYNSANQPVWATGTQGHKVMSMVMQNDSNFVLYGVAPLYDSRGFTKPNASHASGINVNQIVQTGEQLITAVLGLIL